MRFRVLIRRDKIIAVRDSRMLKKLAFYKPGLTRDDEKKHVGQKEEQQV